MATYTDLKQLGNDWQLYNYNPSSRDEFRGLFTHNPLQPMGQHAGPSMDGLMPQYWGDILGANADLLRQRGYTGSFDLRGQDATEGDVRGLVDWMRGQNLVVGQSGPLKDGSARHGSYYTQLFDTSGGGYNPIGTGLQTENDYTADGRGILAVLLAAAGGAALSPGSAGAAGAGGAGGTATLGATGATVPTLASSQIAQLAPVISGMSPVAMTAPALAVGGAAAAGGSGGAGGLLAGNADKAALFTDAGYGAGMSGNATTAFDTVAGLTGNNQLGAAAGNAVDGNWLQAAQNVGGNMDWLDWGKLGLQALGAYQGAQQAKDQTQTVNRDPWGPAQPFILDALQQGQKLNQQYQQQPFSQQQQAAYNNLGGLLSAVNQGIPGLLSGMQANASGANNFDRSNPRRQLQGAQQTYGNWQPGLLDFFPRKGG